MLCLFLATTENARVASWDSVTLLLMARCPLVNNHVPIFKGQFSFSPTLGWPIVLSNEQLSCLAKMTTTAGAILCILLPCLKIIEVLVLF
jgi:hypothetical protein